MWLHLQRVRTDFEVSDGNQLKVMFLYLTLSIFLSPLLVLLSSSCLKYQCSVTVLSTLFHCFVFLTLKWYSRLSLLFNVRPLLFFVLSASVHLSLLHCQLRFFSVTPTPREVDMLNFNDLSLLRGLVAKRH